jgi:hypothetical protein
MTKKEERFDWERCDERRQVQNCIQLTKNKRGKNVRVAPKIKLKNANKKRTVTVRRVIL